MAPTVTTTGNTHVTTTTAPTASPSPSCMIGNIDLSGIPQLSGDSGSIGSDLFVFLPCLDATESCGPAGASRQNVTGKAFHFRDDGECLEMLGSEATQQVCAGSSDEPVEGTQLCFSLSAGQRIPAGCAPGKGEDCTMYSSRYMFTCDPYGDGSLQWSEPVSGTYAFTASLPCTDSLGYSGSPCFPQTACPWYVPPPPVTPGPVVTTSPTSVPKLATLAVTTKAWFYCVLGAGVLIAWLSVALLPFGYAYKRRYGKWRFWPKGKTMLYSKWLIGMSCVAVACAMVTVWSALGFTNSLGQYHQTQCTTLTPWTTTEAICTQEECVEEGGDDDGFDGGEGFHPIEGSSSSRRLLEEECEPEETTCYSALWSVQYTDVLTNQVIYTEIDQESLEEIDPYCEWADMTCPCWYSEDDHSAAWTLVSEDVWLWGLIGAPIGFLVSSIFCCLLVKHQFKFALKYRRATRGGQLDEESALLNGSQGRKPVSKAKNGRGRKPVGKAKNGQGTNQVSKAKKSSTAHSSIPLHTAAWEGNLTEVKRLLDAGALIDERNANGFTAWNKAAFAGRVNVLQELKARGASTENCTNKGWSGAHAAAFNGHLDTLRYLDSIGCDMAGKTLGGSTPHRLAASKHPASAEYLFSRGYNKT